MQEVKVIDDTEEETVTDEPIIRGGEVEQTKEPLTEETEELPEQGNEVSVSPIYRQYLDVQKANPQAVVLLRLGDFYEVMGENARTVAEELDLTLTSREVGLPERVPMCGFPYHVAEVYASSIIVHIFQKKRFKRRCDFLCARFVRMNTVRKIRFRQP